MFVKEIFERFDKNKDGKLSLHEFREAFLVFSNNFSEDEIVELFKEGDVDGDSELNADEFTSSVENLSKEAFAFCDVDDDGKITFKEFYATINGPGNEYTEEICAAKFEAIDKDGDGYLRFEEFMAWLIGASQEKVNNLV